jgi:asparagine synthase (glutamine-hydrolysing)
MCGIAAITRTTAPTGALQARISAMCDAIVHRGPDDEGNVIRAPAALGMRRLSIIDVSGGHQPIPNEDESAWIVFNGEVYNHHQLRARLEALGHRFRTRSDTEVILHGYEEWGDAVVRELHGMFTFAIWDERQERLFAARDQLGIKPLYYWVTPDGVALCSELRSFLALPDFPRAISHDALLGYLALGYVPHPHAIFAAARKLHPGSWLSWSRAEGVSVERYWDPTAIPQVQIDEVEACRRLQAHLAEAVESHLESEVPLGAFLSGGLDSSTVVALMARASRRQVRTFSIGFREQSFDESGHAAAVARALGTDHTAVTLTPSAEALVDRVTAIYDEPFADSSALPTYLVSALAREHVTVSLSGDGGDELFGGYNWYAALANRPASPGPLAPVAAWAAGAWPVGVPGRGRLLDYAAPRHERMNARHAVSLPASAGGLLTQAASSTGPQIGDWFGGEWDRVADRDFVTQMTQVDLANYLPGDILTKVDRASMAVSLEARVPLLHLPLVEFALSLPGSLKVSGGMTKYLFRQAIKGLVPPEVLRHRKQGFSVPLGRWFREELRPELGQLEALTHDFPGIFEPGAIARLVQGHLARRGDRSTMLWRLLVLRRWMMHLRAGDLQKPVPRVALADLLAGRAPALRHA